jgi:hypothetical protein
MGNNIENSYEPQNVENGENQNQSGGKETMSYGNNVVGSPEWVRKTMDLVHNIKEGSRKLAEERKGHPTDFVIDETGPALVEDINLLRVKELYQNALSGHPEPKQVGKLWMEMDKITGVVKVGYWGKGDNGLRQYTYIKDSEQYVLVMNIIDAIKAQIDSQNYPNSIISEPVKQELPTTKPASNGLKQGQHPVQSSLFPEMNQSFYDTPTVPPPPDYDNGLNKEKKDDWWND